MHYRQVRAISGRGLGPDSFSRELRGLRVDRADRLWAVGDGEVKVFDVQGKFLRHWRTESEGTCITTLANADAKDAALVVFVGQVGGYERYDESGKRLGAFRDEGRLGRVTAIGFAGGDVLLADVTHRCIRRYGQSGRFINDIGEKNNTHGFLVPNGHLDFAVDAEGIIHAANPGKYRIERYRTSGELLGHFGRFGAKRPEDFPGCCNPTNMTLMPDGRVVVTEKAPPRMKVYDQKGTMLALVGPEAFDANCRNMDVAVDSNERIYVADTARLRILVFASDEAPPASGPAAAETKGGMAS
jgi:sugar lactone lactonase YvrE